jgi:peptide/nickel transport system substrate-binding protein
LRATSLEERKKLAAAIQERAFEIVPFLPTGQCSPVTAYRKNVKGVISAPALMMWNVEKS